MAKKSSESEILEDAMARVRGDQDEETGGIESPADLKRRAAREAAEKERAHKAALAKVPAEAEVCYTPLEDGDKIMTIFHGVKFMANKPVKVRNKELILKASTNPWFTVNGKGTKRVLPEARTEEEEEALRAALPPGISDKNMVELAEIE